MRVTQRRDFDGSDEMRRFVCRRSVFLSRRLCLRGVPGAPWPCVAAGGGLVQHKAMERDCAGSWRWTQWVREGVVGYREG